MMIWSGFEIYFVLIYVDIQPQLSHPTNSSQAVQKRALPTRGAPKVTFTISQPLPFVGLIFRRRYPKETMGWRPKTIPKKNVEMKMSNVVYLHALSAHSRNVHRAQLDPCMPLLKIWCKCAGKKSDIRSAYFSANAASQQLPRFFHYPTQGWVTVPFWEYGTSPYSSHYRPYT